MERFTTSLVDPSKRLKMWRDVLADVYFKLQVDKVKLDISGDIRRTSIGNTSITSYESDHLRAVRTKQSIAVDPDDSYLFLMPTRGAIETRQSSRSVTVVPGGFVLLSSSEFYELQCPDGYSNLTVKIPGDELRRRLPNVDDYCVSLNPPNLELTAIVRSHVKRLLHLSMSDAPTCHSLANHAIDLVSLTIGAMHAGVEPTGHHALRRRVQEYIHSHLTDVSLNPRKIANGNGISLSYLYKIFQSVGQPVNEYIISQRLNCAYEMLTTLQGLRLTVAEVAYRAGFKSVPHFSRLFAKKYNISPGRLQQTR